MMLSWWRGRLRRWLNLSWTVLLVAKLREEHEGRDSRVIPQDQYQKIQKKLADCRVSVAELEMEHLMFDLENGRSLDDFSQSEIESLRSYTKKRIWQINISASLDTEDRRGNTSTRDTLTTIVKLLRGIEYLV
ncbi:hypothetical protein Bca52824_021666 [Brassica carinata]|uniref:Uncharacterized protein n=1 Tax=Brassica carinata TaxID=52824 RepID=A0A8X7VF03_BRACI|nr:hypothetical protein Bca52824_021666 [Brassica carinata]